MVIGRVVRVPATAMEGVSGCCWGQAAARCRRMPRGARRWRPVPPAKAWMGPPGAARQAPAPERGPVRRQALRAAFLPCQLALGWTYPDAVMQYAVPALEEVSIDMVALAARRDRMLGALEGWGYRLTRPEGTFYLWGEAPGGPNDHECTHPPRNPRFCPA